MNIIHIIPTLQTGGAERLALDICLEFSKRNNINVKLIVLSDLIHFENPKFVKIIKASVVLSIFRQNQYNVEALESEIKSFQPNIIHTHLFHAEIISRCVKYPKAKWFSHFHDNIPQIQNFSFQHIFNKNRITNFYEKQFLIKSYKKNGGNSFVTISEDTKNYAERVLPKEFKTYYLKNAINFKKFFIEKEFRNDTRLELINIGSFQAKKNQKFLIDITEKLLLLGLNFKLTLLGDGVLKKEIQELVRNKNLEKYIVFEGNVKNVEKYLHKADIYLHSAYYEPFGLVLIEAMAAGLPVITLDGKGNRDIIEQGKNGYMIFEQDTDKFADTIIKLWNDKNEMNKISNYANKFAKKYDIVNYVDKLLELYQNAIDLK